MTRLPRYGHFLIENLHCHHDWEDWSYFPQLSAGDARFDTGLEIVGHDYHVRDVPLGCLAAGTWRGQTWIRIDPLAAHDQAGSMHDLSQPLETHMDQHLVDEKHPMIPIIIH